MKPLIVGITGASGGPYAWRLLEKLNEEAFEVFVVATKPGLEVFEYEMGFSLEIGLSRLKKGLFHQEEVSASSLPSPADPVGLQAWSFVPVPWALSDALLPAPVTIF